jgi:ribokinase
MVAAGPPGILVLGGINMDLVTVSDRFPSPGETVVGSRFLTYAGGKGANQAVAAARMGGRVFMVGRVGTDAFGGQLLEALSASGVDVTAVGRSDTTSGIAVINIDRAGQNRIVQVLGANDTCGEDEARQIDRLLPQCSTVMLQLEVSLELSLRVARQAYGLGKTVILDPGPVREIPSEFFRFCSCITPNETEAEALCGFPVHDRESAVEAAAFLLDQGAGCAIVTLGEQGAIYSHPEGSGHQPAFAVAAVDSVGAGDAFNGGLAVAWAEGLALPEAVKTAAAVGSLSVTKSGAQDSMPTRQEVETLLRASGGLP